MYIVSYNKIRSSHDSLTRPIVWDIQVIFVCLTHSVIFVPFYVPLFYIAVACGINTGYPLDVLDSEVLSNSIDVCPLD